MVWMVMVVLYTLEVDAFTEEILSVGESSAKDVRVKLSGRIGKEKKQAFLNWKKVQKD